MHHLHLCFLGSYQVTLGGRPIKRFRSIKVQGLLAFLSIEAGRPHQREVLAGMFWPEQPEQVARQNLRQSLYQLRQLIDSHPPDAETTPPF